MKKQRLKRSIILLTLVILGSFGHVMPTMAKGAFTLSPMDQKIVLIPGETYRGSISISNPAGLNDNFNYLVTIGSYSVKAGQDSKDDYGAVDFAMTSNMNAIMDWIRIDNPKGEIVPNGRATVSFSIEVPEDAPAGGQYASLAVQEDPETVEDNGSTTIQEIMQMSHIIYAEVAGETVKKGAITENNIPSFLLNNTLMATSMVRNDGNVHANAEYILQVWPLGSEEEICTNEEKPSTNLIMPKTTKYHEEGCRLPLVGIFRAKQTVKIFGEISIVEKTVIVCPIWLLFVIIFAIAAIIIYIVAKARKRKINKETV